jgi:segregation and condensation protein B
LAIAAYNQPIDRDEADRLRGISSGGVLSQLVGCELLRIERPEEKPRYHTTDRFLKLFGLESLEELPQSHDFDRAGG